MAADRDTGAGNELVSDGDRDRVAEELRMHCVQGRITLHELEGRLEVALSARTFRQLSTAVSDLPVVAREAPAPAPIGTRIRVPGVLRFSERRVIPVPRGQVREAVHLKLRPTLHAFGYRTVELSPGGFVFERQTRRSSWAFLPAILYFPFGLIALAFTGPTSARIVVSLERYEIDQTLLAVNGAAPRPVRKAFAELTVP